MKVPFIVSFSQKESNQKKSKIKLKKKKGKKSYITGGLNL